MEAMEKKYELRNPVAKDMPLMFRILSKVGVKELKGCFASVDVKNAIQAMNGGAGNDDALATVGISVMFDIVSVMLDRMEGCMGDIFLLLSRLTGLKVSEIEEMEMAEIADMLMDVVSHKAFRDFFTVVYKRFVKET